jgi:predicted Na+-dependent transporter
MSLLMGLLIDLSTVFKIIKIPIPVAIGLVCQYVCMPLLAFAFIKIFSIKGVNALAVFIYGCCPGGSSSNNWTIMLDGDIDLSVVMTFTSTISSLG